jgi:zinc protease
VKAKRVLFSALALTFLACGGNDPQPVAPQPKPLPLVAPPIAIPEAARITPDAPFRASAPAPDGTVKFTPPRVVEAKLKNGLRVLVVERHELPVVSVRLVVGVGAGDLPDAKPGVVNFMGAMLEQGTKKLDALKLSDEFESIGAQHGAGFDWDSGSVGVKVLHDRLEKALELLAQVALEPSFPDGEIERLRARRIAGIQSEKSSPGAIASNNVAAALFGRAHPYGHSMSGEESDVKKITRADIVKTYDRLFSPQNAAIVVSGDVTQDKLLPKLEAAFGGWKARPGAVTRKPPTAPKAPAVKKRIVFVDRPGAQSQVQLAKIGVPFANKDREAIVVTNAILGGMFSSRINMNLREKNAYTYGARSYFSMRHGAGPFLVAAPVHADKTGAAIKEVFTEIEGLRKDGPTPDELALAKESIRLAMPGRFETPSDVTNAVADLVVYDLPLDDFEKRLARIEAVTAADVKRIANEYVVPDALTLVVVGDKKTVGPQVEGVGLGAYEERDPYGNALGDEKKPDDKKPEPPKK